MIKMKDYKKLDALRKQLNDMPWASFDKLIIRLVEDFINGKNDATDADKLVMLSKRVGYREALRDIAVKQFGADIPSPLGAVTDDLKEANTALKKELKNYGL